MSSAREDWKANKAWFSDYRHREQPPGPDSDSSDGEIDDKSSGQVINTDTTKFVYRESLENGEIRVLELLPGRRNDPLAGRLRKRRLEACDDQYEALSYVWGSEPDGSAWILLDGAALSITSNLYCALVNLRSPDRSRALWVDAVCINQGDKDERNAQVPLMCEIYRNAAKTVCFLSKKHNTTRRLFAMLTDLCQEANQIPANSLAHDYTFELSDFAKLKVDPNKSELREKYLGDLTVLAIAACKWWHRAWTAQEILLSKRVVFMIGRRTITWEDFRTAVEYGLRLQIWAVVSDGFIVDQAIVPYLSIRDLMDRRHSKTPARSQELDGNQGHFGDPASYLLRLLTLSRHRGARDPRDKIYAVLGLLRDSFPGALTSEHPDNLDIQLDYHHPTVYVYRKVSETIISRLNHLDILGHCPKSDRRALPSWVTDWSITSPLGSPLTRDSWHRNRTTHATKNTDADAQFPGDAVTMIVSGHEIAKISDVAQVLPVVNHPTPEDMAYLELPKRLMSFWLKNVGASFHRVRKVLANAREGTTEIMTVYSVIFAWARFYVEKTPTNTNEDPESIFWQTMCAATYGAGGKESTEKLYRTWFEILKPVREFLEEHPDTSSHLPEITYLKIQQSAWDSYGEFWSYITCAQHRRMGRTTNGWLCLLPEEAQKDDSIVLVKGARVPLVIRPDDDGYNRFIGEAYVHGAMDGERFRAEDCVDIRIC